MEAAIDWTVRQKWKGSQTACRIVLLAMAILLTYSGASTAQSNPADPLIVPASSWSWLLVYTPLGRVGFTTISGNAIYQHLKDGRHALYFDDDGTVHGNWRVELEVGGSTADGFLIQRGTDAMPMHFRGRVYSHDVDGRRYSIITLVDEGGATLLLKSN